MLQTCTLSFMLTLPYNFIKELHCVKYKIVILCTSKIGLALNTEAYTELLAHWHYSQPYQTSSKCFKAQWKENLFTQCIGYLS